MTTYKFATDAESGELDAVDFEAAKALLDEMVDGSDGGFGWVEDVDGDRYEVSDE